MSLRGQHLEWCECPECARKKYLLLEEPPLFPHHPSCNCLSCMNERADSEMRSNKPRTIEISAVRERAELPAYLGLFHRHFEKAIPTVATPEATVNAPVDQLGLLLPPDLIEGIEEISITYRKEA